MPPRSQAICRRKQILWKCTFLKTWVSLLASCQLSEKSVQDLLPFCKVTATMALVILVQCQNRGCWSGFLPFLEERNRCIWLFIPEILMCKKNLPFKRFFQVLPLILLNSHLELFSVCVAGRSMDPRVCVYCTCGLLSNIHSKWNHRGVYKKYSLVTFKRLKWLGLGYSCFLRAVTVFQLWWWKKFDR